MSIIQLLELITKHLRSKLGVRKIPLPYVTRADPILPNSGTIYATLLYSEGVDSFHEELIARAYHKHPNFTDDNGVVLDVLVAFLKTTRHMSDLKKNQKRRDGRGGLAALELHNMGNSKWDSIVSGAESKVLTFKWNVKRAATRLLTTFLCIDQPIITWFEQKTVLNTSLQMNTLGFNSCLNQSSLQLSGSYQLSQPYWEILLGGETSNKRKTSSF